MLFACCTCPDIGVVAFVLDELFDIPALPLLEDMFMPADMLPDVAFPAEVVPEEPAPEEADALTITSPAIHGWTWQK